MMKSASPINIIKVAEDAIWAIRETQGTAYKYICEGCGKPNNFWKYYCQECDMKNCNKEDEIQQEGQ